VEFLRHVSQPVTVEVFYGGWCGDSRDHVPSFIKLLEAVNNSNITPMFLGVDRQKHEPLGLARDRRIERVPTFIVFTEGHEIGRIVETPEGSVEEHMVKILRSPARNHD
jgi:hypothetical protein